MIRVSNAREIHPIQDSPAGWTDAQRLRHLELHTAMLWDQVWWLSLPWWRRWYYRAQGFRDPIRTFYTQVE